MVFLSMWRLFNIFSPQRIDRNVARNGGWAWKMKTLGKDIFAVFMPALLLWTLITWWTFM